ncbi:hypothetical protein, partial [Pseudomonas edaphica]|uniref:hypothetical protein n=1 Tax=Pseudomonas edaphica TaxID=2006980 RepID=UPI00197F09B6
VWGPLRSPTQGKPARHNNFALRNPINRAGISLSSPFANKIENIICFICIQKHNSLRASS